MKIKKFLFSLIVCISAFAFAFAAAGCDIGTRSDATQTPGSGAGNGNNNQGGGDTPSEDDPFTVTLVTTRLDAEGNEVSEVFLYTDGLSAQWRNMETGALVTAEFDSNHVASTTGLDGEYSVTIVGLDPAEDTYDTNSQTNIATNASRDVQIEVLEVGTYTKNSRQNGTEYNPYRLNSPGYYSVVIENASDQIYFTFSPSSNGVYVLTSWVNANENLVNPIARQYSGEFFSGSYTIYNGITDAEYAHTQNSFTKNFMFSFEFDDSMVGGGYKFSISAEQRYDEYPVTINFAIVRETDYSFDEMEVGVVLPMEEFVDANTLPGYGELTYVYSVAEGNSDYRIFDQSLVYYNEEDGYYYVRSDSGEDKILYAYINSLNPIFERINQDSGDSPSVPPIQPISSFDIMGDTLAMYDDDLDIRLDYRLFVRGFADAGSQGNEGVYEAYTGDFYYTSVEVNSSGYPVTTRKLYEGSVSEEQFHGWSGYSLHCNRHGMYLVTAELKDFFDFLCRTNTYFYDGNGYENTPDLDGYTYDAYDDSMWLMFCAYYT